MLEVDDGTGVITCVNWNQELRSEVDLKIGNIVTVSGRLILYENDVQITINSYNKEVDPNVELLHWVNVMKANRIYSLPNPGINAEALLNPNLNQSIMKPKPPKLDPLSDLINSFILEHIKYNTSFQFQDLTKHPDLLKKIKDSKLEVDSANALSIQVSKIVRLLLNQGIIYFKDEQMDIYEVVSSDNLGKALLNIMINESKQVEKKEDIYLDEITLKLHSDYPQYRKIPRSIVSKIMSESTQIKNLGGNKFVLCKPFIQ